MISASDVKGLSNLESDLKKVLFVKSIEFKNIFGIEIELMLLKALDIEYFSRETSWNH